MSKMTVMVDQIAERLGLPPRKRSREAQRLDIARDAFAAAYDRQPTNDETGLLRERLAITAVGDRPRDLLRSVTGIFDRHYYPTPVCIRFGKEHLTTIDLGDFQMLIDRDDWSVSQHIALTKSYEPWLANFIRKHVKAGMTTLDVGANIGVHSMLLASIVGPQGKVISFDPNSENCRLILLNAEKNGFKNIELMPLALWDRRRFALFRTAIGSNGFIQPTTTERLLDHNCVVVPCERLDALFPDHPIHFIKADIEGAEHRAFRGAENILRTQRPLITSEFNPGLSRSISGMDGVDFLRWMVSLGYRVVLVDRDAMSTHDVSDVDVLVADWGSAARVEDLAFIPN
jgi:FkbM family methyltransferase